MRFPKLLLLEVKFNLGDYMSDQGKYLRMSSPPRHAEGSRDLQGDGAARDLQGDAADRNVGDEILGHDTRQRSRRGWS